MGRNSRPPKDPTSIGGTLWAEREAAGLTVTEMADRMGKSKSYISGVEQGHNTPNPYFINLYRKCLQMEKGAEISVSSMETVVAQGTAEMYKGGTQPMSDDIHVSDGLGRATLKDKIVTSQSRIWILDTWIDSNIERMGEAFEQVCRNNPEIEIKIALVAPDSPYSTSRGEELGQQSAIMIAGEKVLKANIQSIQSWGLANIELRTYKIRPTVEMYLFDNEVHIGFYLHSVQSRSGPQFVAPWMEGDRLTTVGLFFEEEFNLIWDGADVVKMNKK